MQPRTRRQREILDFINDYTERKGYKPSYQLIARHLGIASKSAVAKHIAALEKQGILQRRTENGSFTLDMHPARSIADAVSEIEWLELPKTDAFCEEFENNPLFVPKFMLGFLDPSRIRAFRVTDDAMIDEHICEGDIALIEKRSFARDGACVVADVGGRILLQRYYRLGAFIELRPANKNFAPLRVSAEKVSVYGVMRGLLRPLS
jgi:SOS regulatory protein LexA